MHEMIVFNHKITMKTMKKYGNSCSPVLSSMFINVPMNGSLPVSVNKSVSRKNYHCRWYFKAPQGMKVHVHVTKWKYSGPTDSNCSFGGLAILNIKPNRWPSSVVTRLCGKMSVEHDGMEGFHATSVDSLLYIQAVFFYPYSQGHLQVEVSTINCLVYSNPCLFPFAHPYFQYVLYRDRALRHISKPCVIIQQLEEFKQRNLGDCHIKSMAALYDVKLWLVNSFYLPGPTVATETLCRFFEDDDQFSLPYLVFSENKQRLHAPQIIFHENMPIKYHFKEESSVFLWSCMSLGFQLPFYMIMVNIDMRVRLIRSGHLQVSRVPNNAWNHLPFTTENHYIEALNITNLFDVYQFPAGTMAKDKPQLNTWTQLSVIVFYFTQCPHTCTNDSLVISTTGASTRSKWINRLTLINPPQRPLIHPFHLLDTGHSRPLHIKVSVTRSVADENAVGVCHKFQQKCRLGYSIQATHLPRLPVCPQVKSIAQGNVKGHFYFYESILTCFYVPLFDDISPLTWYGARRECIRKGFELARFDKIIFSDQHLLLKLKNSLWADLELAGDHGRLSQTSAFIGIELTVSASQIDILESDPQPRKCLLKNHKAKSKFLLLQNSKNDETMHF